MLNIPRIPYPQSVAPDAVDVKPVSNLRATKPVSERSLIPLVFSQYQRLERVGSGVFPGAPPRSERRHGTERRGLCRRIEQKGMGPFDTRGAEERRNGNRRDSDMTTQIEENI